MNYLTSGICSHDLGEIDLKSDPVHGSADLVVVGQIFDWADSCDDWATIVNVFQSDVLDGLSGDTLQRKIFNLTLRLAQLIFFQHITYETLTSILASSS